MIRLETLAQRIAVNEDGCWIWTGHLGNNGRPKCGRGEVHRDAYLRLVGPVPEGLELDHLCAVKLCVNPYHLEPVTHAENMRRRYLLITHCIRGHEFSAGNTRIELKYGNRRRCRKCEVIREAAYLKRKREKAAAMAGTS